MYTNLPQLGMEAFDSCAIAAADLKWTGGGLGIPYVSEKNISLMSSGTLSHGRPLTGKDLPRITLKMNHS